MRTTLRILAVIGIAVLYRYILMDLTFSVNGSYATYFFREIVGFGLMFQIVPSVVIKAWREVI